MDVNGVYYSPYVSHTQHTNTHTRARARTHTQIGALEIEPGFELLATPDSDSDSAKLLPVTRKEIRVTS